MSTATVIKADAVQMVYLDRRMEDGRRASDRDREARLRAEVDAAYQSGVADGRRAAEADGLAAMPNVAAALDRAAAELAAAVAGRAAGDAETLLGYATEIARWILGREVEADPAAVIGRIETALAGLSPNSRLVVRVSPASVDLVRRWAEGRDADVVADPSLTAGEARLDAGHAAADLTWAQAFNRVRAAFDLDDVAGPATPPAGVPAAGVPAGGAGPADLSLPEGEPAA